MTFRDQFSALRDRFLTKQNSKQPEDVFTPRAAKVNPIMYVDRPDLERALQSGLNGSLTLVIHGESGCGKSWLYKKVLSDLRAHYIVGNLAKAVSMGSIGAEFDNILANRPRKKEERRGGEGSIGVLGNTGTLTREETLEYGKRNSFELILEECRRQAGRARAVLVLDNWEQIVDKPELLKELASFIILLDDERCAKHEVKLVIVGATSEFQRYYAGNPHILTLENRLLELSEVPRFTLQQCEKLIMHGFSELGLQIPDEYRPIIINHIASVTHRVPQYLHEYGLEFSRLVIEKNAPIIPALLLEVDQQWRRQLQGKEVLDRDELLVPQVEPQESRVEPQVVEPRVVESRVVESRVEPRVETDAPRVLSRPLGRAYRFLGCLLAKIVLAALVGYLLVYFYFLVIF